MNTVPTGEAVLKHTQMLEITLCFKRIKREMPFIEFVEYEKQEKLSYFLLLS